MFLASRFKEQQYQVTTAESASGALAIMEKRNSNFDVVIADLDMPRMAIYEFVRKVHHQSMTTPVILIAEDITSQLLMEATGNGVSFLFSKPPSDSEIMYTWQHVGRVTGQLPALTDITSSFDGEECGGTGIGRGCRGAAINLNLRNVITSVEEHNSREEFCCNPKRSRMTWTAPHQGEFLKAINIMGEQEARAHPNSVFGMMKDPGLTNIDVSSHLQNYRKRQRLHINPQGTALPVMPAVLPTVPLGNFEKEQTFDFAKANYMATEGALLNAPKFVGYTLEFVKQKLDALNYSGNNITNAISNNGSVQVGEENREVQISESIDSKRKSNANGNASAHMTNGFQAPTSAQLTNGLQDPNQDPTSDFEMGTVGSGNAGNLANMSHANIGGGSSGANQQHFSEMSGDDDIKKLIQELEASEVDLSDLLFY
ncbi:hypothetical protein AgCh_004829 [Apium graveolens]